MTLDEAKQYIQSVRWQYAKTYVTAPHEYTVVDWKPETKQQIVDFVQSPDFKHKYSMSLRDVEEQMNTRLKA